MAERHDYTGIKINFTTLLLSRENATQKNHKIMLKLNQQQRCNFADCTIVPEVNEDEIWYFRNQKYKDLMKPYQEFVLFKKYLLVAHSNILSCFDTFRKKWICH